ncbi:Hsp70 family protein [bacterium]|nr:Hsp70 family protein [bacterium]
MAEKKLKRGPLIETVKTLLFVIGLDFGTTLSKVSVIDEIGRSVIVKCKGKEIQIASAVVHADGQVICGGHALSYATVFPDSFFEEFKRLLGQTDGQGRPLVLGHDPKTGAEITPVVLAGEFMTYLKSMVEEELQGEIGGVVITVPAYFTDLGRRHVLEAARLAGLPVLGLLDEPVAAAITYKAEYDIEGTFAVVDLGGGTLDVSLIRFDPDAAEPFKVLATEGDQELGATDFNLNLMEHVLSLFKAEHGYEPDSDQDQADLQELKSKVTVARMDLSEVDSVVIPVRIRTHQTNVTVARSKFEELNQPILDKIVGTVRLTLQKANLEASEVDHFLLVGGGTRMPCVETVVAEAFGRRVMAIKDREFAVAKGAAIQAVNVAKKSSDSEIVSAVLHLPAPEIEIKNKTAHPLCVQVADPANPQSGRVFCHVMIPAQSSIPCSVEQRFTPLADYQQFANVVVCQGEEGTAVLSGTIAGRVNLPLNPPLPRDQRRDSILVRYSIDSDALIHVSAKDLMSGTEVSGDITLVSEKAPVSS